MRHGRACEIKKRETVGAERALQLSGRNFLDAGDRVLLTRVIDKNVEFVETIHGRRHGLATKYLVADVARQHKTRTTLGLDHLTGGPCVVVLFQIDDRHISAFARIMHCHGAPDAAVATGDKCNLVLELCAAAVIIAYGERLGHHRLRAGGLRGLMLRIAGLVILVMVLHTVATLGKSRKACSTSGPISLPRTGSNRDTPSAS